jgi:hypothetical protein
MQVMTDKNKFDYLLLSSPHFAFSVQLTETRTHNSEVLRQQGATNKSSS